MLQFIHITAAYSNAVLIAVLPHVSDCAKQLGQPIHQPVATSQVGRFVVDPIQGEVGGGLWLTNNYWFRFQNGYVGGFRSPDDWFTMADEYWDHLERYVGKDNMTTNEAIELARNSFRKLGYKPKDFHVDEPPTAFEASHDNKQLGHIPYCKIEWNSPGPASQEEFDRSYKIRFDIDMQRKQVVGMTLMSKRFFQSDPKVGVQPELESDYRKRMGGKMFFRTNVLTRFQPSPIIQTNSAPP